MTLGRVPAPPPAPHTPPQAPRLPASTPPPTTAGRSLTLLTSTRPHHSSLLGLSREKAAPLVDAPLSCNSCSIIGRRVRRLGRTAHIRARIGSIHRSAWKGYSAKFAGTGLLRSSSSESSPLRQRHHRTSQTARLPLRGVGA